MFCTKCGNILNDNDRFCGRCGTPVAQAPTPPAQAAPAQKAAAQIPPTQAPSAQKALNSGMPRPIIRRFKAEGVMVVNYNMPFRDENDNLIYQAKTVTESMFQWTFRAWYPDRRVAFTVKTKTHNMMTMFFELTDAGGRLITTIDQKISGNLAYMYLMPEVGLQAQGDFVNFNFGVFRNEQLVAEVKRDLTLVKDSYQAVIYDPSVEVPVLGLMMAIQLATAVSRHRNNRR